MGWLDGKVSENKDAPKRRAQFEASGIPTNPLEWHPDIAADENIVKACERMGWAWPTGFSPTPIPFMEIEACARCTGLISEDWEFETARQMSESYVSGLLSKEQVDPALWTAYKGLLAPLVMPQGRTEAKLVALAQEA